MIYIPKHFKVEELVDSTTFSSYSTNIIWQKFNPDMLKALKGVSARLLMKEYGDELKKKLWGGHLWNPLYFIATLSEKTEEQIKN
jgi:REP element-mobilizing transposase RayT